MERQVWNPVTGWWENVPDPRSVALLATIAHLLVAAGGLSVMIDPPLFLAAGLGDGFLTLYWGALLAFGGTVGAASVLPGAYWAERIALACMAVALVLYVFAMVDLQRRVGSNIDYQAWINGALLVHVLIRGERVRFGMRDPERLTERRRRER